MTDQFPDATKKVLSPAAQAVLDAVHSGKSATDRYNILYRWVAAAALQAAVDQVLPEEPHPGESQFWDDEAKQEWQNNQHFRKQLLSIAAELGGANA